MNKRKGFTVVELVVVIAIIAILAAVLIPTFAHLIRKGNVSADTQLIRNLNTALVTDSAAKGNKPHANMTEALKAAFDAGYDVAKINRSAADNEILWDSKNDLFCYFDSDAQGNAIEKIKYIPNSELKIAKSTDLDEYQENAVNLVDYWVIADAPSTVYSTYLFGFTGTTVDATTGVDTGTIAGIETVNYTGSANGQTVTIRTTEGTLNVNAPKDTVNHFDNAAAVKIEAVKGSSYHEFGQIGYINIKKGRLVIEETSDIQGIFIEATGNEFDKIVIALVGNAQLPSVAIDDSVVLGDTDKKLVLEIQRIASADATDSDPEYVWLEKNGSGVNPVISTDDELDNGEIKGKDTTSSAATAIISKVTPSAKKIDTDSVARIGAVGYGTLQTAINAAKDGDVVTVLKDISLNPTEKGDRTVVAYCLWISKNITIDGDNHKVTLHPNSNLRGVGVKGNNATNRVSLTVKNIEFAYETDNIGSASVTYSNTLHVFDTRGNIDSVSFDNVTMINHGVYAQIFTVGGSQTTSATINIKDSTFECANDKAGYTITLFNPANITIDHSNLTGWACINFKGKTGSAGSAGSIVNVKGGSKLISVNPYTGETNNYGAVKYEDTQSNKCKATFEDTTIELSSWQGKYQSVGAFDSGVSGILELGSGVIVNCAGIDGATPIAVNGNNAQITVTGGKYQNDVSRYVPEGYSITESEGYFVVTKD